MSLRQSLLLLSLLLVTLLGFQNCGYFSNGLDTASLSSVGCDVDLTPTFNAGYYAFLTTNSCNNCHDVAGTGTGAFAQTDAFKAFEEFDIPGRGPAKINSKLQGGHQGYSYSSLQVELESLKTQWEDEITAQCADNGFKTTAGQSLTFFEATDVNNVGKKRILVDNPSTPTGPHANFKKIQTIVFELGNGSFQPNISNAKISMDVEIFYDVDFFYPTHYTVKNLKIISEDHSLEVEGITVLLNGDPHLVTTFQGIIKTIPAGTTSFESIDDGGSAAVFLKSETEPYDNTDTWSIRFDHLSVL